MSHPVVIFCDMKTHTQTHADEPRQPTSGAVSVQQPLPYDDERDLPIGYVLTPAAKQLLVPGSRPQLSAVPPLSEDDYERDPRRAQVKAMYRGGLTPEAIATQLEIDLLLVRGWLELAPVIRHERPASDAPKEPQRLTEQDAYRVGQQLREDPKFAFGVGVLAATAEIAADSVTCSFTDEALAATVLTLLGEHGPLTDVTLHVILRLAPRSHGDVVRSRWAGVLGVDPLQLRTVRRRTDGADEALIRIVDKDVAALCALWCHTALHNPHGAIDVAF